MSIRELLEDSGVYFIPAEKLPKDAWFLRDPALRTETDLGPLLHICEKEMEDSSGESVWVVITEEVRWDFVRGHYKCRGCKKTWGGQDTNGLRAIWSDGYGTGDEGRA